MKKLPKLLTQAVLTTVILNGCTKEKIVQPDNHIATVTVNPSMQSSDTTSTESLKKKAGAIKYPKKKK